MLQLNRTAKCVTQTVKNSIQALNATSTTKNQGRRAIQRKEKKTTGSQTFIVNIYFSLRTLMYQFPQAITQCAPIRTRAQLKSRISNKLPVDTKPNELSFAPSLTM
jgi:hypothetical protein